MSDSFSCQIPRLRTERLLLREPRPEDFPAFSADASDPVSREHTGGALDTRATWERFLRGAGSWVIWGMGGWTVELLGTGPIGTVGVFRREGSPQIEMGWVIHRAHTGQGYAVEAARAALNFAFEERGASRVIAQINKENMASIAVAKKLGMICEGEVDFYGEIIWLFAADRVK